MHEGKSFGKFVAEGLLSDQTRRVYLAHQRNSQEKGAYVVKVLSVDKTDATDLSGMARRWLDGVSLQDRVAQDWHDVVAPVVERPTKAAEVLEALNTGHVWYVTRRYAGSLSDVLGRLGGNPAPADVIWMVCRAVTRGVLAFKQVDTPAGGRRSHGNLKPGNILFSQLPVIEGRTEIVVTDPAPVLEEGDAANPARVEKEFEQSDLAEIGRVLFQLVAGRALPGDVDWSSVWNLPEADPVRWRQVFGRAAANWRSVCQELLQAGGAGEPPTLAGIDQRLATMKPRVEHAVLPKVIAVAALLIVTGVVSWLVTTRQIRGVIIVDVKNPPGLEADVTVRQRGRNQEVNTSPLVNGEAEFNLKSGYDYEVTVQPKGAFSRLAASTVPQIVEPRSRTRLDVRIDFVRLMISAHDIKRKPVAAELTLDGNTNEIHSLPVSLYLAPTNRPHQLDIAPPKDIKVLSTNLIVMLNRSGETLETNVVLNPELPGFASVIFRAGETLPITFQVDDKSFELGRDRFQMPLQFRRGTRIRVTTRPPVPWEALSTNWIVPDTNRVEFPLGFLHLDTMVQLKWTNTPTYSRLFVARNSDEKPELLGSIWDQRFTYFPPKPATYSFVVSCKGFRNWTNNEVAIQPGTTNVITIADLEPMPTKTMIFEVSPPDAILSETGSHTGFSAGTNDLAYGTYSIVALHPMLGSITNTFVVDFSSATTQRWALPAGLVSISTGQAGLEVMVYPDDPNLARVYDDQNGNNWLRSGQPIPWTTPVVNAPLPPGGYSIVFSDGRNSATNHIQVALNQSTNIDLPQIKFSK